MGNIFNIVSFGDHLAALLAAGETNSAKFIYQERSSVQIWGGDITSVGRDLELGRITERLRAHEREIPELGVAELKDVRVFGRKSLSVITRENLILCNMNQDEILWRAPNYVCDRVDSERELHISPNRINFYCPRLEDPVEYVDEICALIGFRTQTNLYHWLFDVLPRLLLLHKSGRKNLCKYYVFSQDLLAYQRKMLYALGIEESQIKLIGDAPVQFKSLLVPSTMGRAGIGYSNSVRSFYRDFLKENERLIGPGVGSKIYISRADRPNDPRPVKNLSEVEKIIASHGYIFVTPGTLDIWTSISIFANAGQVVGFYGAGLANFIFAPDAAQLLVLHAFPFRYDLDYSSLFSDPSRRLRYMWLPDSEPLNDFVVNGLYVDIELLGDILTRSG